MPILGNDGIPTPICMPRLVLAPLPVGAPDARLGLREAAELPKEHLEDNGMESNMY